jgi:hypothetical protein
MGENNLKQGGKTQYEEDVNYRFLSTTPKV